MILRSGGSVVLGNKLCALFRFCFYVYAFVFFLYRGSGRRVAERGRDSAVVLVVDFDF